MESKETMETMERDHNEPEITSYRQTCPRHGSRISLYHGCPKCVIEKVRRMEQRLDPSLLREDPIAA